MNEETAGNDERWAGQHLEAATGEMAQTGDLQQARRNPKQLRGTGKGCFMYGIIGQAVYDVIGRVLPATAVAISRNPSVCRQLQTPRMATAP